MAIVMDFETSLKDSNSPQGAYFREAAFVLIGSGFGLASMLNCQNFMDTVSFSNGLVTCVTAALAGASFYAAHISKRAADKMMSDSFELLKMEPSVANNLVRSMAEDIRTDQSMEFVRKSSKSGLWIVFNKAENTFSTMDCSDYNKWKNKTAQAYKHRGEVLTIG